MMRPIYWISLSGILIAGVIGSFIWQRTAKENEYEKETHYYRLGKKLNQNRSYEKALKAFSKNIKSRKEAPESHLEVGLLYQNYYKDPIFAIYHYRKSIEGKASQVERSQIQGLINSSMKDFLRQFPAKPYKIHLDRLATLEKIESLKTENAQLKKSLNKHIKLLKSVLARSKQTVYIKKPTSLPNHTHNAQNKKINSYRVKSDDTLASISLRFYGTKDRWQDIFFANKTKLKNPYALKVGQKLNIPPK